MSQLVAQPMRQIRGFSMKTSNRGLFDKLSYRFINDFYRSFLIRKMLVFSISKMGFPKTRLSGGAKNGRYNFPSNPTAPAGWRKSHETFRPFVGFYPTLDKTVMAFPAPQSSNLSDAYILPICPQIVHHFWHLQIPAYLLFPRHKTPVHFHHFQDYLDYHLHVFQ